MAEVRSASIYQAYQDAIGKLDHLITGVAVGLVGYLGTRAPDAAIGVNSSTAELIALTAFIGSAYCGIRRLERNTALLGAMHRHLHEEEAATALVGPASKGAPLIDLSTGQVYTPEAALHRAQKHKANAQALDTHMDSVGKKAAWWFRWRDRFLMLGLLLLAAGRLVAMWPN